MNMLSRRFSEQEFDRAITGVQDYYDKKIANIRVNQQQGGSDSGGIWMQRLNIISISEDQDGIIVVVK